MGLKQRPLEKGDLAVVEFETSESSRKIVCKHGSKHMSFNTKPYNASSVVERGDGVAYDPKTSTFYQTRRFRK